MLREERERMRQEMRKERTIPCGESPTQPEALQRAKTPREVETAHRDFVDASMCDVDWRGVMNLRSAGAGAVNEIAMLPGPISGISYFADWLSEEDAANLERAVRSARSDKWVQLRTSGRKLQQWGGIAGGSKSDQKTGPFPLPAYQTALADRLVKEGVFSPELRPNHVLVNEYMPGQGIMAHRDGPAYHNTVAIVSLGSPCIMSFFPYTEASTPRSALVLQPRSLLVFQGEAYDSYLHGIAGLKREMVGGVGGPVANAGLAGVADGDMIIRDCPRVSLTIRHVPSLAQKSP